MMTNSINSYYKIPDNLLDVSSETSAELPSCFFKIGDQAVGYGRLKQNGNKQPENIEDVASAENVEKHYKNQNGTVLLPYDLDEVVNNLRQERYIDNSVTEANLSTKKRLVRNIYYMVRPLFPVAVRRHLQKYSLKGWEDKQFPQWPVDSSVENTMESVLTFILKEGIVDSIPFIWFWPKGYESCSVVTHDVETEEGLNFCDTLMDITDEYQLKSSFELIPEVRYQVSDAVLEKIKQRGFEVCIHGLNHDGNLYKSKEIFDERAKKINQYAEKFGAIGFRSPVMYRNIDWYNQYEFKYDLSMPNVGHLDPQPGGCCTVMPYFIGKILEIPLTTIQDYPLYYNLNRYDLDLWKQQCELIMKKNGIISFIIHPDYTLDEKSQQNYRGLLNHLKSLREEKGLWTALPKEVYAWWDLRSQLHLEKLNGQWKIVGDGAEKAALAQMKLTDGALTFEVESG